MKYDYHKLGISESKSAANIHAIILILKICGKFSLVKTTGWLYPSYTVLLQTKTVAEIKVFTTIVCLAKIGIS